MLNIYLTDLSAYNSGALVGKWVNLPCEYIELHASINEVLGKGEAIVSGSNHEEYFVTDYEWKEIELFEISEYCNIFTLNKELELIQDFEPNEMKAIKFLLHKEIVSNIEESIDKIDDVIIYENTSLEDYCYDLIQEIYDMKSLPSIIVNNIDYSSIARDLEYDGVYYEIENDLIVYTP